MPVSVFDVDGCLADTLPLLSWCYTAAAGVTVTREHVRRPWEGWLPSLVGEGEAARVRARKTELYLSALHQHPPRRLPAGDLAAELLRSGEEVYAVSAAKALVTPYVLAAIDLEDLPILAPEVMPWERPTVLPGPCGTYYDDDIATCLFVRMFTDWTTIPTLGET
jgi:hypothetical protein